MRGGNAMGNIKVLWMNNGDGSLSVYVKNEETNLCNLHIVPCGNMKECREKLKNSNWDAVMVNLEPRLDSEKPKWQNFSEAYTDILELAPSVPIFVVTPELQITEWKTKLVEKIGEKIYKLKESSSILYKDIQAASECGENYRIRKEFDKIIEFYKGIIDEESDDNLIIELLKDLRKEDLSRNQLVPANVRLILNNVMSFLTDIDLLQGHPFNGANLSECSQELGKNKKLVPLHVQRSFHSCVEIANNGAHIIPNEIVSEKTRNGNPLYVQAQILSGKAPYLNISLIYDLLNILYWCATLKEEGYEK